MQNYKAVRITVKGRVQGVGFRPFVYSLAEKYTIYGTVQNNMDGVKIIAEGRESSVDEFIKRLQTNAPRLARIDHVEIELVKLHCYQSFTIIPSEREGNSSLVIPVDASMCPTCLEELTDPANVRYQYPFINCTECGPRYTIIKGLPYDRPYTTMANFQMCQLCEEEYNDPLNRRHHAQPIACQKCGPKVSLLSIDKKRVGEGAKAIEKARLALLNGKIIAIKGLGGYHLACNANDDIAVEALRKRKNRPKRPLAVMAKNIIIAETIVQLNDKEKRLLLSPEAPIVVANKRKNQEISNMVAPHMSTLGVMLPYTPLHHLLFQDSQLKIIVMTSANPSGLPMLYEDDLAFSYLNNIADFILTNNRPIEHPIDDSVVQIVDNDLQFFRRARGYAPDPFSCHQSADGIIGLGPQQKNSFAIGRHHQIFLGPHIGDLGSEEVKVHYEKELSHLLKWLDVEPRVIAVDKHPLYETSLIANEIVGKNIVKVQHHHAHLVSCMEDNQWEQPCFGIILDGTGFGDDGHIWGFELLYGDAKSYKRFGHLAYHHLPGGEKAVQEPWRNAAGLILSSFAEKEAIDYCLNLFPEKQNQIQMINGMLKNKLNSPLVGTCGRLFDAVSAITGICFISTYDGEAAIQLSELVSENDHCDQTYAFEITEKAGLHQISFREGLKELIEDVLSDVPKKEIALKFHQTVVEMAIELLLVTVKNHRDLNKTVALSGGSFHNRFLVSKIKSRLEQLAFQVLIHQKVPCNDGGISLGQLVIARQIES